MDLHVLKNSNTRSLFIGQAFSQVCDKMMSVGLVWVVAESFGAFWVPIYTALVTLPHLALAPWNGPLVTKFGALKTVIHTSSIRAVILLAAAGLALLFSNSPSHYLLATLFVVGLSSGIVGAFFNPAILSLPVRIARAPEDVGPITALIDSTYSISNVAGPLLSVLAFTALGLPGLLLLTGASFGFAAWTASRVTETTRDSEVVSSPAPPEQAWKILSRHPLIARTLMAFLLLNLVIAPIAVFFPAYTREVYAGGIGGYAALEIALGLGMILGGLLLTLIPVQRTGRLIVGSIFLIAISYFVFTVSRNAVLGSFAAFAIGLGASLANISILGYFQSDAPAGEIAQIMSVVNLISVACVPVSMAILTVLLPWVGLRPLAIVCATAYVGLAFLIYYLPGLRGITLTRIQPA
ncbi:MAG: MFS transporter [Bdellovibrionota bacterium]